MQIKFKLGEFFCGPGGLGYGASLAKVYNKKTNKEAKREQKEVPKEKVTPERTVLLLKKIIGNQKKRAAKDKKKFSKVLRSASAAARKYKLILNKVTKKST